LGYHFPPLPPAPIHLPLFPPLLLLCTPWPPHRKLFSYGNVDPLTVCLRACLGSIPLFPWRPFFPFRTTTSTVSLPELLFQKYECACPPFNSFSSPPSFLHEFRPSPKSVPALSFLRRSRPRISRSNRVPRLPSPQSSSSSAWRKKFFFSVHSRPDLASNFLGSGLPPSSPFYSFLSPCPPILCRSTHPCLEFALRFSVLSATPIFPLPAASLSSFFHLPLYSMPLGYPLLLGRFPSPFA